MSTALQDLSHRTVAIWSPSRFAGIVSTIVRQAGGRRVMVVEEGARIGELVQTRDISVLLVDEDATKPNPLELIALLAEQCERLAPVVVLMATNPTQNAIERALAAGIGAVVAKPFSAHRLRASVARALSIAQARRADLANCILLD